MKPLRHLVQNSRRCPSSAPFGLHVFHAFPIEDWKEWLWAGIYKSSIQGRHTHREREGGKEGT
jgi:hypothetical protein